VGGLNLIIYRLNLPIIYQYLWHLVFAQLRSQEKKFFWNDLMFLHGCYGDGLYPRLSAGRKMMEASLFLDPRIFFYHHWGCDFPPGYHGYPHSNLVAKATQIAEGWGKSSHLSSLLRISSLPSLGAIFECFFWHFWKIRKFRKVWHWKNYLLMMNCFV